MTASRNVTVRYPSNQPNSNSVLSKRTRGPINKRACQRCRQGKIKCDGDAESGKACSNCDPQHCKYDNSPRKNKQVESLKQRLSLVEDRLVAITRDVGEKLTTKDLEKEILCLLYESKEHFMGTIQNQALFQDLKDALKQSRCLRPVLAITFELLMRLSDNDNAKYIPEIMKSLQRFVDCASNFEKDASVMSTSSSIDIFKKIEGSHLQSSAYPTNDGILSSDQSSMIAMSLPFDNTTCDQVEMNLNLAADDDSSETHSRDYEFNNEDSPPTPPERHQQQQQQHETKCFTTSNVPHLPNQSTMINPNQPSAPDYAIFDNVANVGAVSSDVLYYPNADFNYSPNYFLMNDHQSTTSPTDDPPMGW